MDTVIEFRQVTYQYPLSKEPAIKNLSFEIKDRFEICGATFIDFPRGNPLTNMPTHVLPLTQAHGPDTQLTTSTW